MELPTWFLSSFLVAVVDSAAGWICIEVSPSEWGVVVVGGGGVTFPYFVIVSLQSFFFSSFL